MRRIVCCALVLPLSACGGVEEGFEAESASAAVTDTRIAYDRRDLAGFEVESRSMRADGSDDALLIAGAESASYCAGRARVAYILGDQVRVATAPFDQAAFDGAIVIYEATGSSDSPRAVEISNDCSKVTFQTDNPFPGYGRIWFARVSSGPAELVIDTGLEPIGSGPHWTSLPTFTPDGSSIAYQYNHTTRVIPAGSRDRSPLDGAHLVYGRALRFSPDGARIVFVRSLLDEDDEALFVAGADGSNERLVAPSSEDEDHPSFSADGRQIVFLSRRGWTTCTPLGCIPRNAERAPNLWTATIDSPRVVRRLTSNEDSDLYLQPTSWR